ncbi:MAG: nucleotidyltransferase family protein [Methyloprofundus sp.]|nr:nucleotidyltransferase family protein [Methyloprofundus sp.]
MLIRPLLLAEAFINPQALLVLPLKQWDLLIRQARRANMLAKLAFLLEDHNILQAIPDAPRKHLISAQIHAKRFAASIEWEITCIARALQNEPVKLILLKGAAYYAAGNLAANGRIFSDVDILVPENTLLAVEQALAKAGWMNLSFDAYEQKYYRQWMHEIPPLRHLKRQTSLDVHHNILPKTAKFCPDAASLLNNAVQVKHKNSWVLSTEDRVIHSATHLFYEGELEQGFRDVSDLDFLLKEFSESHNFWQQLLQRATDLKQQLPLYYALRYCRKIFATPIPEGIQRQVERYTSNPLKRILMDALFLRALMPDHPSCDDRWTGLARWLLYIRSHWLRMPMHLLIPHLLRKSWMRLTGKELH